MKHSRKGYSPFKPNRRDIQLALRLYAPIERAEDIDNNAPGDLSPEDEKLAEKLERSVRRPR